MKLDIEKAAREHFAKEMKDPKRDLDYLTHCNYDFTAGANYATMQYTAQIAELKEALEKISKFEIHMGSDYILWIKMKDIARETLKKRGG